jgi:hypothetical protein
VEDNVLSEYLLTLSLFVGIAGAAQWNPLPVTGAIRGRTQHTAIFDQLTRGMVVYAGGAGDLLSDVWRLTNADGSAPSNWTQVHPVGTPPLPRAGHSAVYDAAGDAMIVFAGSACSDDTWLLTNPFGKTASPTEWRALSPPSRPPARFMHSAVFDSASRRMIVFGGSNGCPPALRNDVWILSDLDTNNPKWTQLLPSGTPPAGRFAHSAVYDPVTNRMIIFGGSNQTPGGFMGDIFALSNANGLGGPPVWTQLTSLGPAPAPRDMISAVYDSSTDEMTVVGGLGTTFFDDVWTLRNTRTTPSWSQLSTSGATPNAPTGYSLVYSAATQTTILFGGIPGFGGGYSNSVWTLSKSAAVADTSLFATFDDTATVDHSLTWRIGAGAGAGSGQTVAHFMAPTVDGTLTRLELMASRGVGSGKLIAHLMSDDSGPARVIESFLINVASSVPSLVSASSTARPVLLRTKRYWLVLTTPDLNNDTILWHARSGQPMTLVAVGQGKSPALGVASGVGAMVRLWGDPLASLGTPLLTSPPDLALLPSRSNLALRWDAVMGAASYDVYFGTSDPPALQGNTTTTTYTLEAVGESTYYWSVVARGPFGKMASAVRQFTAGTSVQEQGLSFTPVTPCRVVDTRPGQGTTLAFGPPVMAGGESRSFPLPSGRCGIPFGARAYSVNVTVVPRGPLSYLTIWPTAQSLPFVSTLNSFDGGIVANAAIVPADQNGAVSVFVTASTDLILDINGYFDTSSSVDALSFYTLTPCRIADTRNPPGAWGGPSLAGGQARVFPVRSSPCGIPGTARAYSLNVTAVPHGPLSYLTLWPSGQGQPFVSTLNSPAGRIVANTALTPAGSSGDASVYATSNSDVILDINGYFAPRGNPGAMLLHPVTPCRLLDTRNTNATFGGPQPAGGSTRLVPVPSRACGTPPDAKAYSLNITVVPDEPLGYLSAWPGVSPQPFVSTLNSDGRVVANAAIVPAGDNATVAIFVTNRTHVVVDVNGFFTQTNPLPPPSRIGPVDGAVFNIFPRTFVYSWNPVPGATRYGLQIEYCQPGRTDCRAWFLTSTTASSVTHNFVGLQPGRWRVWSIDDVTGEVSARSTWWWFESLQ